MSGEKNQWPDSGEAFRKMYANMVVNRIKKGYIHATLGPKLQPFRWENARNNCAGLMALGIKPSDVVVDYGCGTLRIGRFFINELDAGNYIGLDIDQRILDIGREILDPEQVAKEPQLKVISGDTLRQAADLKPRLIFAKGVIHHVPPADLDECLANIGSLIQGDECQALICHNVGDTSKQVTAVSWEYSFSDLAESATRNDLLLKPFPALGPKNKSWYQLSKTT